MKRFKIKKSGIKDKSTGLIWSKEKHPVLNWEDEMKTIKDKKTSLEWKVQDEGKMTWDEAMSLELKDGWRVPTIKELLTLVSYKRTEPALRKKFLSFTNNSSDYWSCSTFADGSHYAWRVNFDFGYSYDYGKNSDYHVRLVRDLKPTRLLDIADEFLADKVENVYDENDVATQVVKYSDVIEMVEKMEKNK